MGPRKRGRDEMESSEPPKETSLLNRIRNMWEFACVMQYIFIFGKAVKIDEDFDIEDFEAECLKPGNSEKLEEIGLTLLKWISSHRGLTLDNWDEYTRRQYVAKSPHINPYGTEEEPRAFRSFDIFQKIRVLHQLTVWTFWNPDRMRERMPEQKETDQTIWRVEELGWDRDERSYFVLDDSRLYRRTEPPLPPAPKAKPKSNTLKAQAARRRASKRRRIEASATPEVKDEDQSMVTDSNAVEDELSHNRQADTFAGYQWECVAVTSQDYQEFLKTIEKSRDPNEKDLHLRIVEQVLPVVEKAEEAQRRKTEKKQKELLNEQRLMGAKRSSRLADKQERERQEREALEAAEKHAAELAAAHREQERQAKVEQDRQSRMMTREQRIREREYKRLLHEEELAKMAEEAKRVETGEARGSERHLKAQMEKHKRDLERLSADEDWVFDCSGCGVYGKNVDDGAHSVACEKCNVWQHSKCLGIRQVEAEKDDFHFVCKDCKQKMEDAKRPNIRLTFRAGLSSSPPQRREKHLAQEPAQILKFRAVEIPAQKPQNQGHPSQGDSSISNTNMQPPHKGANGVVPSPYLQHAAHTASGYSSHQKSLSPNADPSSTSASMNGFPQSQPKYPYPSNPPHAQSTSPSPTTNGYTFHHFQSRQGSGISSQNGDNEHSHRGIYQPQNFSQQPQSPPNSTPQTRPSTGQTTNGVSPTATPNTQHHGRVPSPVLNRPSMSPTQGNPDVGPVAGVPQRSPTAMSMSPSPYQSFSNQRETNTATPQSHFSHQSSSFTNGEINTRTPNTNISNNQYQHQPFHLSGLSPTKHSPSTATLPAHSVSANPSISSPHLLSATAARSVSGTSIFPPTEMLHPSPNQLSKTPVPTPSKATMATSGAERNELGKVSEQIRDQVSREAEG